MQNKGFLRFAWASLVVIFLVIIAGSIVRVTGSGMGCPDWPKCFGYYIPPTEESQVLFQQNFEYSKHQMILINDELVRAKQAFTSNDNYDATNWEVYEKHDYAIFNPTHTWVEYLNRLIGALSGIFVFVLFIWSFILAWQKKLPKFVSFLCFSVVILIGFQAWLGKTVVDSNLSGAKITAHLFGALAIVVVMMAIIRYTKTANILQLSKNVKQFAWLAALAFCVQLYLGTEFRIVVDEFLPTESFADLFAHSEFKWHRSFAWLLLALTGLLLYKVKQKKQWNIVFTLLIVFLLAEVFVGISLSHFNLPKLAQPTHLLLASILTACFSWILMAKKTK